MQARAIRELISETEEPLPEDFLVEILNWRLVKITLSTGSLILRHCELLHCCQKEELALHCLHLHCLHSALVMDSAMDCIAFLFLAMDSGLHSWQVVSNHCVSKKEPELFCIDALVCRGLKPLIEKVELELPCSLFDSVCLTSGLSDDALLDVSVFSSNDLVDTVGLK